MGLDGKTAIVTGAGRGIGRAIALAYARNGARVVLAAKTRAQLEETRELIEAGGGEAAVAATDVADPSSVAALVDVARRTYGPIDVLVNNAGSFTAIGPVEEVDPDHWWRDVTVNVLGIFHCCRAVLPEMKRRKSGVIINLIGGGTGGPFPYGSGYGTSKAAVMRFSETLAAEVKESGISVFPMGPGLVRTRMTEYQMDTPEGRKWMARIVGMLERNETRPPEDAAQLAAALGGGEYSELTGRAFNAGDDLAEVLRRKDEILAGQERTLRLVP